MFDEPARHQQTHGKEHRHNREPVPPSPPQCEQEADSQYNASNLAGNDVEATEDEESTDEGGAKVACWEGDGADSSVHVRNSALPWIERNGFHASSGTACGYGMSKFMESNDKHLYHVSTRFFCFKCLPLTLNGHSDQRI